ncbi:hypothetical protein IWQ60_002798 [Tieghemiomyces parasiticus]|uniref:U3 small nucleolar RNA-associated protein 11 n=1 Tax=Tieghemiomyces parasiticus TaxID=78921 RepID=A0A9W8ABH1_9FUNG|nr:hypothetical protein IWQ60_002798 [Tieghemiomyces parasiticus]
MSSIRNAISRPAYRERAQPVSREELGHLEKRKDYLIRAQKTKQEKKRIKFLAEKARLRNPDEFHPSMVSVKGKSGEALLMDNKANREEYNSLVESQDLRYIRACIQTERKKIDRLQSAIDLLNTGLGDMAQEDDSEEEEEPQVKPKAKTNHTVFVDTVEDLQRFDPATHFQTPGNLLKRKYNRPRVSQLASYEVPELDPKVRQENERRRFRMLKELDSRLDRERIMALAEKQLMANALKKDKSEKMVVGKDKDGIPIYKFKAERKR